MAKGQHGYGSANCLHGCTCRRHVISPEHAEKISRANKGKPWGPNNREKRCAILVERNPSAKQRQLCSAAMKGRQFSPEVRAKISATKRQPGPANELCEVCGRPSKNGRLSQDHNHETGQKRGKLCSTCNGALGMVGEDPKILRSMIQYIEKFDR